MANRRLVTWLAAGVAVLVLLVAAVALAPGLTPGPAPMAAAPPAANGEDAHADAAAEGPPADGFTLHVDAQHPVGGLERTTVHHWCRVNATGLTQCLLFDGDGANATLVGVENILPKEAVAALPPHEQRFWHDHAEEIPAANATLPGLSEDEASEVVATLNGTAGKVVYVWYFPAGETPEGAPFVELPHEGEVFHEGE